MNDQRNRILILVDGGIVKVLASTIDVDVIVIDKDAAQVGDEGYAKCVLYANTFEQFQQFVDEQDPNKWLEEWEHFGDDMHCPNCKRAGTIETMDDYTECGVCGWGAYNPVSASNNEEDDE